MKVGKSIQEIRKNNGLSQEQFANMFHVTRQTVSNWENEKSYPDLQTLIAISEQFEVSLDKLMKEDPQMAKEIDKERKKVKIFTLVLVSLLPFLVGGINHYLIIYGPLFITEFFQHTLHMAGLCIWGYACYKVATADRKFWIQVGILNLPGVIMTIDNILYYTGNYLVPSAHQLFLDDYFENSVCITFRVYSYLERNNIYGPFLQNGAAQLILIYVAAWIIMLAISVIAVFLKTKKES